VFIFKILIMVGLIKLLLFTNKPLLCASIYAGAAILMALLVGRPVSIILLAAIFAFALSAAYFWLLDTFQDSGIIWWIIMIVGFAIGFV
jgi:hypothetical protein